MFGTRGPRLVLLAAVAATLGPAGGCSDGQATPIDSKAAIDKVSKGDGTKQSAGARAASEEAARKHPKLR